MFFKNQQLDNRFAQWMDELNERGGYGALYGKKTPFVHTVGKRYIKIIECLGNGTQKSVFAFVDADGNIYKPDGWAKPSKYIRAHLTNEKLPMVFGELYAGRL